MSYKPRFTLKDDDDTESYISAAQNTERKTVNDAEKKISELEKENTYEPKTMYSRKYPNDLPQKEKDGYKQQERGNGSPSRNYSKEMQRKYTPYNNRPKSAVSSEVFSEEAQRKEYPRERREDDRSLRSSTPQSKTQNTTEEDKYVPLKSTDPSNTTQKTVQKETKVEVPLKEMSKDEPKKQVIKDRTPATPKDLSTLRKDTSQLPTNCSAHLLYVQSQIKQTEMLLAELKEEENRLMNTVTRGGISKQTDTTVVLDVLCVLPNGKQAWINVTKDDNAETKAAEFAKDYQLSKENEAKITEIITQVQQEQTA
ncbi:hypothetical protein EIN_327400 [Entamoeba invadens IP1]|uniref:Uncharacterized protein n=1 Tax=Entamoeba invadens IP1 TaxID=370355 RepID=A0A0A1U0L2_ENTIV|nr:hypothetical protein EIN_327400 [Entamoeba invadens IP1]ELP86093.1 hypothetical protein EIN_327400 [Entamoeba invadens IP1]|eukprot:XP_004185439.1 hypothetical protein EIN_327400 [Entamoeba invadens IP1]